MWAVLPGQDCLGDCDRDGKVRVGEIVSAVAIALGRSPASICAAFSHEGEGVSVARLVAAVGNALRGCRSPYFGDLHVHWQPHLFRPGGVVSPAGAFAIGRYRIGFDFMAITEHDFALDPAALSRLNQATDEAHAPGRFVAFSGVEWSKAQHMNVVLKHNSQDLCECPDLLAFYEDYRGAVVAGDAVVHVCHPSWPYALGWLEVDDTVAANVEVWNVGTAESESSSYSAVWGLRAGFHLGFVGVSDDHRTGLADPLIGKAATACHAASLTRDSLMEALRKRSCYATTGQRIGVDLRVGDACMGSELAAPMGTVLAVNVSVVAPEPPVAIELVKNRFIVDRVVCETSLCELATEVGIRDPHNFVFARVVQSGEGRAWSSPIWIEGTCGQGEEGSACLARQLAARLAPGGVDTGDVGSRSEECLTQILFPEDGLVSGYQLDPAEILCRDGDSACDVGVAVGECEVEVGLCFGLADERFPECSSAIADSFKVLQPVAGSHISIDGVNRTALGAIFRAAHTTQAKPRCSPMSELKVAAGERRVFEFVTRAGQRIDRDRLVVECLAAAEE